MPGHLLLGSVPLAQAGRTLIPGHHGSVPGAAGGDNRSNPAEHPRAGAQEGGDGQDDQRVPLQQLGHGQGGGEHGQADPSGQGALADANGGGEDQADRGHGQAAGEGRHQPDRAEPLVAPQQRQHQVAG